MVACSNYAVAGPARLDPHGVAACAAGLCVGVGARLEGAVSRGMMMQWTDVRQMLGAAPRLTHVLCVPFARGGGVDGALVCGFAHAPRLDLRRLAALTLLASCLPRCLLDRWPAVAYACGL